MITGVWTTWNFQQNKELDFGVVEFPKLFEKSANFGDSHTFVLLKTNDTLKQKASAEFIKWISENSYEWALSGQVPANQTVLQTKKFKKLPFRKTYVQSAHNMALYPKHLKLKECNDAMIRILKDFLVSDDSVDEVMLKGEKKLNSILEKSK
jgi:multiple sugar transport system substrate-binding protein